VLRASTQFTPYVAPAVAPRLALQCSALAFIEAAPDAVGDADVDGPVEAGSLDGTASADAAGLVCTLLAGAAGADREEQVRIPGQAGTMLLPVMVCCSHAAAGRRGR
jgi:hypothetical protein